MPYYYTDKIIAESSFVWDEEKEARNKEIHGLGFIEASMAFSDPKRVIIRDALHSQHEERFYCLGKVGGRVLTVRFTQRGGHIRIFGAGYWKKGRRHYEKETKKSI